MTAPAAWLDVPADHPYGIDNLPYGVFSVENAAAVVGIRIGDRALDLAACATRGGFESAWVWQQPTLNRFLAEGPSAWAAARVWIIERLTNPAYRDEVEPFLYPLDAIRLRLPVEIGDYVDFYASEHHARNVGRIFRPDSPDLPVAWPHLPIGYHGRAGTVVVSGTEVIRPHGQRRAPGEAAPVFGPSIRLDIEAELGFVCAGTTALGEPIPIERAGEHLFGVVVLNDWSARDIQAWEYTPLGPFLGKSFATSISAWVTPLSALTGARCALPTPVDRPRPALLPYLCGGDETVYGLDVHLAVDLNGSVISRPEYRDMTYSPTQMLAHLTVNGASLRDGDLFGSGTISGADPGTLGSLLELTWNGTEPLALADGARRGFLQDGDTVTIRAWADTADGGRIGLGECTGTIRG